MRLIFLMPVVALCLSGCAAAVATRVVVAARNPDMGHMLQNVDENGDGVVTRVEFTDARSKMFSKVDKNGDGYFSKDDVSQRRLGPRARSGNRTAEIMVVFDKNGDGRISRDEFVNGPTLSFDSADSNHDGVLDADELKAFRTAVTARRQRSS